MKVVNISVGYDVIDYNEPTNKKKIVLVWDNQHKMSPKRCTELIDNL